MDPTLAPNFVPPSEQHPSQRMPRPLPHYLIPNVAPIQPYVLEDFHNSEIDAPFSRNSSASSLADYSHRSGPSSRSLMSSPALSPNTHHHPYNHHHLHTNSSFSSSTGSFSQPTILKLTDSLKNTRFRDHASPSCDDTISEPGSLSVLNENELEESNFHGETDDDYENDNDDEHHLNGGLFMSKKVSSHSSSPSISDRDRRNVPNLPVFLSKKNKQPVKFNSILSTLAQEPSSNSSFLPLSSISDSSHSLNSQVAPSTPTTVPSSYSFQKTNNHIVSSTNSTFDPNTFDSTEELHISSPSEQPLITDMTTTTDSSSRASGESDSPTPAPTTIPRIPSNLDSFSIPNAINTSLSSPNFPHLGPSEYDMSPNTVNTMDVESQIPSQNFVPPSGTTQLYSKPQPDAKPQPSTVPSYNSTTTNSPKQTSIDSRLTPYTLENSTGGARPIVHSADLEEVPVGVSRQARTLEDYKFPTHRLAKVMMDETKSPMVIVACGSFSPITYLHLRMFEMAMDSIREETRFEVIGGYYSPVSDNYKKQGLAAAHHRVRMCELACERTSSWLMVDSWESLQPNYQRTAVVLDHFNHEINIVRGGIATSSGRRKGVKIMLLAGGDLIESMGEPNVWANDDLHHILGRYGCLIVERTGSDVRSFLLSHDIMYEHRRNVLVIKQLIYNDISSTKVRLFIRRGMSVQYLIPNSVIRYIQEHGLYIHETEPVKQVLSEKGD